MHDEQRLIDGYLDDVLSSDELAQLNKLLKNDEEFARSFAVATLMHDRLRTEFAALPAEDRVTISLSRPRRGWLVATLATAASIAAAFLLPHAMTVSPASAASAAVERLIEVAGRQIDRVYHIRVTDFGANGSPPVVMSGGGGKKPGIDGAELVVRGPEQFVLTRTFGDGTKFVTGSDGEIGWAVAPRGHVHLSRDLRRFRRAVPGEHEAIPFLDLRSGLEELRRDYELSLVDPAAAGHDAHGWSRLDAVKHSRVRGGPEQVQIWFDEAGTAQKIALTGIPQDGPEPGPRAVVLELQPERTVAADFFHHEAHHMPDRPIDWE